MGLGLGAVMGVALEVVFSGEHYVVDIAGAAAAAGLVALLARVDYRRLFSRLSSLKLSRLAPLRVWVWPVHSLGMPLRIPRWSRGRFGYILRRRALFQHAE